MKYMSILGKLNNLEERLSVIHNYEIKVPTTKTSYRLHISHVNFASNMLHINIKLLVINK